MQDKNVDVWSTIRKIKIAVTEPGNINEQEGEQREPGSSNIITKRWIKPEEGWLKMKCDGAFDTGSGSAGLEVVVRNGQGSLVDGDGAKVIADYPEVIKALAGKLGVELAVKRKYGKIILESDSKIVCQEHSA
ncbi:hypothetical protein GOBAR_DD03689 [Gossypium barbadense]|nr:hypothetical protein GOBAR_DD03689 [Gossypium barbadense]